MADDLYELAKLVADTRTKLRRWRQPEAVGRYVACSICHNIQMKTHPGQPCSNEFMHVREAAE